MTPRNSRITFELPLATPLARAVKTKISTTSHCRCRRGLTVFDIRGSRIYTGSSLRIWGLTAEIDTKLSKVERNEAAIDGFQLRPANHLKVCTTCVLQYSSIPVDPHSPPIPLSLCPESIARGVVLAHEFRKTLPACICLPTLSAREVSAVHTDAPRPDGVPLARAMTSASSDHLRTGTIGPA